MSNGARIGAVVATVVVLVLAFVLLSPEADDDSNTASTPTTPPVTTTQTPTTTDTTGTAAPAEAEPVPPAADHPVFQRVRVRAGKPVGGVKKITVKKGERARIEVTSPDTSDEIHLHGYDISRDLKAGGRVRFSFDANAEGIFEIELEGAGTQIGQLTVEP